MLKKSLSVFLCIVMCISFFSMTVTDTLAAYDVKTLFSVKGEPVEDNKLNYSISVTKDQKNIGGIILVVKYDSTVLKPGKCEPGKKTTTQSGTTQNFKGTYVYGVSESDPGEYTIAYMNDMAVSTTEALTFFNMEFEVIDKSRPKTTVSFYCKEYYSTSETDKNITVADGLQLIAPFEDISTLAKPVLKSVVPHKDGLEVSWEPVEGAIGYEVRRTSPHNTWESVGEVGADLTTFVDTGLTSGTDYTYTVRAFNNSGVSLYDATGVTCKFVEKPVVTSLRNAVGGIEIKWSETKGADFYVVLRRQVGETEWKEVAKRTYSAGTVYKDTTVKDGVAYEYDVNSATDTFTSVTSDVGMSLTYVATPEIESVTNTLKGIKITWEAHPDATHYIIYKKTVGIDSELLEYSVSSQNYFEDKDGTNVIPGKTYTYAVKACTNDGESAYSVTGYTITRVPSTKVTSLSPEKDAINVQWESINGVTGYVIYRRGVSETKWTTAGIVDKTHNSFSDTGAISGGEYIYAVCPMISASEGAKIESSSVYYISAPENIVSENIIEGIKVTWNSVKGATKYEISRVNADGSSTVLTQIDASQALEYIDENVEWGEIYSYAVKAISPKGESLNDCTASLKRIGAIGIATPEIVDGGIKVTWDGVADAEKYAVFRNDNGNWVQITTVTETEYTDANVKSAVVYSYAVAVIIDGSRGIVNTENAPKLKYIAPPETVTASNGESFIKVSWTAVEGAVKYEVYKTEDAEKIPYRLVATVDSETLSYLDKRVGSGITYNYVVRAVDDEKTSVNSAVTSHIFLSVPDITKIANDYKGVTIKWGTVAGAREYYIYSKISGGKWSCIDTVKGDVNTYTDKNAVNGKVMYYTVKAVNGDSISSFATKTISYIAAPKVTVSNVAKGVKIKWNADENAVNYKVYRKAGNAKGWSLIATVKTNTYTDTKAKNGVDYKYTVRAYNGKKYSGYNPDGWKIRFLSAPKLNSAVSGYGFIKFSWQRVAGAEGYKVYRKYNGGKEWTYLGKTTSLYYKDKNVKNKASYTYTVRAYYGSKMSAYYTSGKTVKYLIAPTVTVENRVEGVQLNWNSVSGASSYYVYRKAGNATAWKKIATVSKNTYIDTKVSSGTTYKYTVRAYGSKTLSGFYGNGWKTIYLSAPELVSAKSYTSGITVKWKPVKKATGYFIFRKEGNGEWIQVGKVSGQKVVTYRDKTAEMGGKYTYTVRAYYGNYRSWFYPGITCIDKY